MKTTRKIIIPQKMLHELYIQKEWSSADIAKKFQTCKHTVLRRLREAGYRIRPAEYYFTKKLREKARTPSWELGYILGVLCGDGHIRRTKSNYYNIELHTPNEEWVDVYKIILEKWSGMKSAKFKGNDDEYQVVLTSKNVYQFLLSINSFRTEKWTVPQIVRNSGRKIQRGFISGWFDAEGNVFQDQVGHRQIRGFSINLSGLKGIQELLAFQGIKSAIYNHGKGIYCICFGGQKKLLKFRTIGLHHPQKNRKFQEMLSSYWVTRRNELLAN